jgi:calcineurin-like phosphoesterase
MGNDFNGWFRNVTTKNLTVTKRATIGNQAIYANQGTAYFVDSGATGASDSRSGTSWATCLA